jgi:hypothetical protein
MYINSLRSEIDFRYRPYLSTNIPFTHLLRVKIPVDASLSDIVKLLDDQIREYNIEQFNYDILYSIDSDDYDVRLKIVYNPSYSSC